jgi:hypothetical protein
MDMSWLRGLRLNRQSAWFGSAQRSGKSGAERHIAAMIEALNEAGLYARIHPGAEGFAAFTRRPDVEGHDPASPLDPEFIDLDRGNFFWVQIMESGLKPVAIGAARLIEAPARKGGLDRLLASQEIFSSKAPPLYAPALEMAPTGLCGLICYAGGYWVAPQYRQRGLIGFVSQLLLAHAFDRWDIDAAGGFVRPRHRRMALAPDKYSFKRALDTKTAYCVGTGAPEELIWVDVQAEELANRYATEPDYAVVREDPTLFDQAGIRLAMG